jgi:hypothetical protein
LIAADGFVNGSFEADGSSGDLRVKAPSGWDVNVPGFKFSGRIVTGWSTDGAYDLSLAANWFVTFSGGEMARVSQMAVLDDVERIEFDLMLRTLNRTAWDPNVCTAMVLIDDDVAWESRFAPGDIRGEYRDQACAIDDKFRDGLPHRVSLGLRVHAAGMLFETYESFWDSVEARPFCNGGGLLPGDFNQDCFVDYDDLAMLADKWLTEAPSYSRYNLSPIDELEDADTVNFFDLAAFGDNWLAGSLQE